MTSHMSKFALLCQAARLLGQVLHHISTDPASCDPIWIHLDRTLQSMLAASLNLDSPDHDQISFIYRHVVLTRPSNPSDKLKLSALAALHAPWFHPDDARVVDTDRSQRARVVFQEINERINTNLVERQCFLGRSPEDMAPWGLFFAYQICGVHMRSGQVTPDSSQIVKSLRETFLAMDVRWNVAGTSHFHYLLISFWICILIV